MNRRGFLRGILAAGVAPYVCTAAGVLMPVKKIIDPFAEAKSIMLAHLFPPGDPMWEISGSIVYPPHKGDTVFYRRWLPYGVDGSITFMDYKITIQ